MPKFPKTLQIIIIEHVDPNLMADAIRLNALSKKCWKSPPTFSYRSQLNCILHGREESNQRRKPPWGLSRIHFAHSAS